MFNVCPWDPLKSYPADNGSNGGYKTADLGQLFYLSAYKAWFRLLKNKTAGTSIPPKQIAVVAASSTYTAYTVELGGTASDPEAAGIRVANADNVAAEEAGLFQVSGIMTAKYTDQGSDTATTAGGGIKIDGSGAGKVDGTAANATQAEGCIGISAAAVNTDDADVVFQPINWIFAP